MHNTTVRSFSIKLDKRGLEMHKFFASCTVIASLIISLPSQAASLDDIAACAGTILGNGAVDFSNGQKEALNEAAEIAYAPYLARIIQEKPARSEIELADKILGASLDAIIGKANANNFTVDTYEQVIGCYRLIAIEALKRLEALKANEKRIRALTQQGLERITRVLSAGR